MPRSGRIKSEIGIYHIVLRGINQQAIFEDDEDCEKMLQTLSDLKEICGYGLFAYCIMKNHCHILLKEGPEELDQIFKRFGPRYVHWYNTKYKRVGHLFQSRFWSEAIENDRHFFAVLRYIHKNPIKAGMCDDLHEYRWSSFNEYIDEQYIIDTDYVFGFINKNDFLLLHQKESNEKHLDTDVIKFRLTDTEASNIIFQISKCNNVSEFQKLCQSNQRVFIKKIRGVGVSIRQLSRLTGVSKGVIERL